MRTRKKPKLIYGIGINDSETPVYWQVDGKMKVCPFYRKWMSMLERCYYEKLHVRRPTYRDCEVTSEWKRFTVFREWMKNQDWEGRHLDKDLLITGNKTYSSETCIFVPQYVNNLLTDRAGKRGAFPQGVCRSFKRFKAQIGINGVSKYIGLYDTPEAASLVYQQALAAKVRETAAELPANEDPRLAPALVRIAGEIEAKLS